MPDILKITLTTACVLAIMALTASCDRGSSSYRHIQDLPYSEWDAYALSIPVEKRLDLSNEILERGGYTPNKTIVYTFQSEPLRTYREISKRISLGDVSPYYVRVIYALDQAPNFSICSQKDRKRIQNYLMKIYPERDPWEPEFYRC